MCWRCLACSKQPPSSEEMSRLQSDLNNQIRALNNSINAIYDNVDAMLEEQNNLFSVSEWAYGDIDD